MGSKVNFQHLFAEKRGFLIELLLNLIVVGTAVLLLNYFFPLLRLLVDPFFLEFIKILGIAVLLLIASVPLVVTSAVFLRQETRPLSTRRTELAVFAYTGMILGLAIPAAIYVDWLVRLTPGLTITILGESITSVFLINLGSLFSFLVGRR